MSGSSNESLPRFLYKYRSLGPSAKENTLSIIRDNALWASSPLYFNDPFDCVPRFSSVGIEDYAKNFVTASLKNTYYNEHYKRIRIQRSIERHSDPGYLHDSWKDSLSDVVGIISLAERFDNCLMWSHYADNHEGICIELDFNLKNSPLRECNRINYSKLRPIFNIYPALSGVLCGREKNHDIFTIFCEKSKDWEYEEEWRYICELAEGSVGTLVKLPPSSITRIIVGARASDECQREIEDIVKQSGSDIEVVRARLDDKEYKIIV